MIWQSYKKKEHDRVQIKYYAIVRRGQSHGGRSLVDTQWKKINICAGGYGADWMKRVFFCASDPSTTKKTTSFGSKEPGRSRVSYSGKRPKKHRHAPPCFRGIKISESGRGVPIENKHPHSLQLLFSRSSSPQNTDWLANRNFPTDQRKDLQKKFVLGRDLIKKSSKSLKDPTFYRHKLKGRFIDMWVVVGREGNFPLLRESCAV